MHETLTDRMLHAAEHCEGMYDLLDEAKALREGAAEIGRLKAQRDAWKDAAEHHYGLLRVALYGDADENHPLEGALDAWVSGRYPALTPNSNSTTP